jgi:hypothetical protein
MWCLTAPICADHMPAHTPRGRRCRRRRRRRCCCRRHRRRHRHHHHATRSLRDEQRVNGQNQRGSTRALRRAWGWAGGTPAARHLPSVLRALATTPPEHHENRPAQMVCRRGLPHLACAVRQWWPWATSALAQWRWHRHGDAPAHENPSNSLARAPKQPRPAARQEPDLAYGEAPDLK